MLRFPVLIASLLLTPVADTVWWRTTGGSVIQHRERGQASCTLTLENESGRIEFVWEDSLPVHVTATQPDWMFSSNQLTTVSVRIGDVWLDGGDGSPNIMAMTGQSALMFVLNQPVGDLLRAARGVAVHTVDSRLEVTLDHRRMQDLAKRLGRCREVIGR